MNRREPAGPRRTRSAGSVLPPNSPRVNFRPRERCAHFMALLTQRSAKAHAALCSRPDADLRGRSELGGRSGPAHGAVADADGERRPGTLTPPKPSGVVSGFRLETVWQQPMTEPCPISLQDAVKTQEEGTSPTSRTRPRPSVRERGSRLAGSVTAPPSPDLLPSRRVVGRGWGPGALLPVSRCRPGDRASLACLPW